MDKPKANGETLLDICKGHPENVNVETWLEYYQAVQDESKGLLPFRVWQFFDALVSFASAGDVEKFVCAAGIVSHYIGDACQPLHISFMFDGDPNDTVRGIKDDRKLGKIEADIPRAAEVHSAYEDDMINRHTPEVFAGVPDAVKKSDLDLRDIKIGHDAAAAVVDLMQSTFEFIHPPEIVNAFNEAKAAGDKPAALADDLWDKFGDNTIQVIAHGCRMLAHFWEAAWQAGNGEQKIKATKAIDQDTLVGIYTQHSFVPSFTLDKIAPVLKDPEGTHASATFTASPTHTAKTAHRDRSKSASTQPPRTQPGKRVSAARAKRTSGH